jgi:hypothetical protein
MMAIKIRGRTLRVLLTLALVLAVAGTASAQRTQGEIRGTVTDTTGGVVPGAAVTLTHVNTGYARDVVTDVRGAFVAPLLEPGPYRVDVTAPGFRPQSQTVSVRAQDATSLLVKLELGDIKEAVEVTAEAEGVNVTSGGVVQRMDEQVLEFPNLNRYGFANAVLMPAVEQNAERPETINASIAGNSTNRNAFYIDGAEASDPWRGWSPRQPVVDAFEEIVVNTAGANVDVGSNFGGTYNAIFKAGTNTFHGGAWYFFRDSSLNANSWTNNFGGLDKPKDPLKYWGGQVGGPIVKDKLFFYVTGSRETDQTPYSQAGLYAPTSAMVNGDFSGLGYDIVDPDTGAPFPGNRIPASRIDPTSAAFWSKYGYTIPSYGPNYSFQFANERKVTNLNGRIDYNITQQHRLTLSGYYFKNETNSADARVQSVSGSSTGGTSGNTFGKGGNELAEYPQAVFNLKWTWMAKPQLFFETHAAYSDMPERVKLAEDSLGTTLQSLGANDPLPRPDAQEMLPSMVIGQWWGSPEGAVLFNGWTTDFEVKNLTFGSSATWITGAHTLKLGAEFQSGDWVNRGAAKPDSIYFNGNQTSNNDPYAGGNGAAFAHGFADFLLGRFDSYNKVDSSNSTLQSWNLAGYVMDTWRVTPRLTITPGLRLDFNSGISEKNDQLTLYRPGVQSTTFPSAPPGVLVPGDPGISESLSGSTTRMAPRVNVAYDVFGDGKTAVRGGVGLYHGRDVLARWQTSYLGRPPFTGASAVARNGVLSDPWLSSQNPTYAAPPFPFVDQNPSSYEWPSQISGFYGLAPDYGLGSSWQWNLAVEREIVPRLTLELSYQGNTSSTTPTAIASNAAVWAEGANDDGSNIQERRPNQFAGDSLPWVVNEGRTRYDQLLLIARIRRATLFGQLSWAWTHGRRNFNGTDAVQNNRDWDQGISNYVYPELLLDFQNNQQISGFFVWDLPLLRGDKSTKGKILGGWQLSANGYWSFANKGSSVYAGYDANADGEGGDLASVKGPISVTRTPISGQGDLLYQWFDPSAFAYPNGTLDRTFGPATTDAGANVLGGLPWAWGLDAGLLKNFAIKGETRLQFRFEVYNLFNHANLSGPNTSVDSPDFGKIRGKYGDGRRIQMGFRFMF